MNEETLYSMQRSTTEQIKGWEWGNHPEFWENLPPEEKVRFAATATIDPRTVGTWVASEEMKKYFPEGIHGKKLLEQEREQEMGIGEHIQTPQDVAHAQAPKGGWPEVKRKHAYLFLETAVNEMKNRASQRDTQPNHGGAGERSMAATVRAFNALTGHSLTEAEGWEFMILLKLVRGRQGAFRMDDYVDAAAYAALLGECESQAR